MQSAQDVYNSSVSYWPYDEQLLLAALILEGVTNKKPRPETKTERQSILDILEELPGGRIFKTSAEVDAYLREERDSWDR